MPPNGILGAQPKASIGFLARIPATHPVRYKQDVFTGLVQALGEVRLLAAGRLVVSVPDSWPGDPFALGESVAVNGCCLTVVDSANGLAFDLSPETLSRTNLGQFQPGQPVNLERAMRPQDRFGGHYVQGHVDQVGEVVSIRQEGESWTYRFRVPGAPPGLLIDKGSIALDGISLTVVEPADNEFDVAVIPHTRTATNLGRLSGGSFVNVEFDMIAKHVAKLMEAWR